MDCWAATLIEPNIVIPLYWERWKAKTSHLTREERDGYLSLLFHQWQFGFVPVEDQKTMTAIIGGSRAGARSIWGVVQVFFQQTCPCGCGRRRNRRLEEVRGEQSRVLTRNQINGAKGGRPRKPKQNPNETQTGTQTEPFRVPSSEYPIQENQISVSARPQNARATSAAGMSPLDWGNKHSDHVAGFCDWMCFPADLAAQFAGRFAERESVPVGEKHHAVVRGWAQRVRTSGVVPSGQWYEFWNREWTRSYGEESTTKTAKTKAVLQRFVMGGRDVS